MTKARILEPEWPPSARSRRLALLVATVSALFVADLLFGSVRVPLAEALRVLAGGAAESPANGAILLRFRLPKAIVALAAGSALAASGLLLQTVFKNPLAGPDVLGINSGASVGVALLVLAAGGGASSLLGGLGLGGYALLALAATLGAGAVLALVLFLARRFEDAVTLLILGMLVGYVTGAAVSLLVYFGAPAKVQVYLAWTYGSFGGVTLRQLPVFLGALALGFLLLTRARKPLDALLLGDRYAASLGVDVKRERARAIAAAALLSGATTAFCGPVAFVGIAAPQAARRWLRSSDHGLLIPASALMGAAFCLGADLVAQLPADGSVLPVNPLLAVVGAPLILSVFVKRSAEERA
ncbi:MAG: iron ABC transporter permease [Spirochaetaceae bacterium]|nr:iron ABC transporter permease [Spirochaetaceae bacterium]